MKMIIWRNYTPIKIWGLIIFIRILEMYFHFIRKWQLETIILCNPITIKYCLGKVILIFDPQSFQNSIQPEFYSQYPQSNFRSYPNFNSFQSAKHSNFNTFVPKKENNNKAFQNSDLKLKAISFNHVEENKISKNDSQEGIYDLSIWSNDKNQIISPLLTQQIRTTTPPSIPQKTNETNDFLESEKSFNILNPNAYGSFSPISSNEIEKVNDSK